MEEQFTPEPEDKKGGGNQRILLLLLLLVVAAFGYVYYFTGVFQPPAEEAKPTAPPEAQVKKPLPPREEGAAPAPEAKPEGEKPAASTAPPAPKPAEKAPSPAPANAPEKPAAKAPEKPAAKVPAKPAEKSAKPEEKSKAAAAPKQEVAKAPAAKAEPKKQLAKAEEKPAQKEAKPAKDQAKQAEQKEKPAPKQAVAKKAESKPVKKETAVAEKPVAGGYTLVVGTYVVPSSMDADKEKVKKAGLTPVIVKGPKKPEPMVRIFIGDFPDRAAAEAEVQKVKKATEDAFILEEKGRFSVYGGSYFVRDRAESERKRLAGEGVNTTLRNASVAVGTLQLRAGTFADKDAARKEADRLKKLGLKVVVAPAK